MTGPVDTLDARESAENLSGDTVVMLIRAFEEIAKHWDLSELDISCLIGSQGLSTLRQSPEEIPAETKRRVLLIYLIHSSLHTIFLEPERALRWIRKPNNAFEGNSALYVMKHDGARGIDRVASYLASVAWGL